MGTYIHAYAERRSNGQWFPASLSGLVTGDDHPAKLLDGQNYTLFGWLADVRNYAKVPPLSLARGLPADVSEEIAHLADNARERGHGRFSWLGLRELVAFDYEATFENRRTGNGGSQYGDTYPVGLGEVVTYREAFGQWFFDDIDKLKALGDIDDVRMVFWFD